MKTSPAISSAFAVALLALTAHNTIAFVEAQVSEPCGLTLCPRPRDIERVAEIEVHPDVSGRVAMYHYLRQRIAGSSLTIPPWLVEYRWFFERVARLRIEVAAGPMVITPDTERGIRRSAPWRPWLRLGQRRRKHQVWQVMRLALAGRGDYVLAESQKRFGDLFLIPASLYREGQAPSPGKAP